MGMFFVIAMVTGFFQEGFKDMMKIQVRKRKLFVRTGIVAAFILLDNDDSGGVSFEEFTVFFFIF